MVKIENLTQVYRKGRSSVSALSDVQFQAKSGEFVVVRGASGSGKTTLLLAIGAMMQPSQGVVTINNVDIYQMNNAERTRFRAKNIGFVFQMFHLIPYLNVRDNICLSMHGHKNDKLEELVCSLGLSSRITHRPAELSAGERQRVALARAMVHSPNIILADEPTGNLDSENASIVYETLADYRNSGKTVIVVTHGTMANDFADRILVLNEGRLESL